MDNHADPISAHDLIALVGEAQDVRALLDNHPGPFESTLLSDLKHEIDGLVYANRDRAGRLVEAAEWVADRLGDHASLALAAAAKARLLYAQGLYSEAEPLFSEATGTLHASGCDIEAAGLAKQHMATLMQLARYPEAFNIARHARRILTRQKERRLLAEHETNVGNLHYSLDQHRKALDRYDRALALLGDTGDPTAVAYIQHNRAAVLFELDRFEEALTLYGQALAAYRSLGIETLALQVELAVAYIEFLKGHYYESLRRFGAAREAGKAVLNPVDAALTDLDLVEVYLQLNALPEAEQAARRATSIFTQAGMIRERGSAMRWLAVTLARGGDETASAALFAEVIDLLDRNSLDVQAALTRLELASVLLRRNEWDLASRAAHDAGHVFQRARLGARQRRARLLEAQATFGSGDHIAAGRLARASLRSASKAGDDAVAHQALHVLARVAAARGSRSVALGLYQKAIAAVERLRSRIVVDDFKSRFLEDKVDLYEGAVHLCLEEGSPERVAEALRTLELAKSRSLSDLLSDYLREHLPGPESGRAARERFKKLVDELAWYSSRREREGSEPPSGDGARREFRRRNRELEACEVRVAEAFRQLQVEDAQFAELQSPHVVELAELQQMLGVDEALVEFACTEGHYSAIVITDGGLHAIRNLASASYIDSLLDGLRFQMDKFLYGREFAARELVHLRRGADLYLRRLHDALLAPIETIAGDRSLVVIPHGRLHYVPMHALFDGTRYAVERRAVSYAPSATIFALCARMPRTPLDDALLCGVADAHAPEIAREIDVLRTIFPHARVLTGPEATRASIAANAESRGLLHIASHAIFRADNPMLSCLRLADGDMTFYDVFSLRLTADLVVLSGCNTGAVTIGAGDELHGLMRGFLYAGAPSLLISMWAADDTATTSLMQTFYTHLQSGATKRDALRAAQCAALEQFEHPYYWAPFTLLGRAY